MKIEQRDHDGALALTVGILVHHKNPEKIAEPGVTQ